MSDEILKRSHGRKNDELRPIRITRNYIKWPEGSCLVEMGETKIIVTASISDRIPRWMRDSNNSWITAEYDMLPAATSSRRRRDRTGNMPGRSSEIQRLIGRSLRAAFNLDGIGEVSIYVDCDVIQADGGTRCASITGGFVAVYDAFKKAVRNGLLRKMPDFSVVSAISVGIIKGTPLLDLPYEEDSNADVDMNVVMDEKKEIIEIQGTGEGTKFTREEMNTLLDLAEKGNSELSAYIKELLRI